MTTPDILPFLVCEWARKYRQLLWNLIPLYNYKKAPTETPWEIYETRMTTDEEFNSWFGNPPPNLTGIALITGRSSGVMAVDEDLYVSPDNVFHIDSKMVSQTASGGRHKIFKDNPEIDKHGLTKIELKNLGNIIVLPPSVVIKKPYEQELLGQYKWLSRCPLDELASLSPVDFEKYRKIPSSPLGTKFNWNEVPGTIPGARHGTLISAAGHLWNQVETGRMTEETAWMMFIAANNTLNPPKGDIVELRRIFTDARDYVRKNPSSKSNRGNPYSANQNQSTKSIPKPKKMGEVGIIRIEERRQEKLAPKTGYPELDSLIRGFVPKHLLTLTGETNMGKTAICANFAVRVARQGKKVLYLALEPDTSIIDSLACARTGKKFDDLTEEDLAWNDPNINLYTEEIRTIGDLKTAILQSESEIKYDLVIIDHIGYFVRGASDGSYIQEQANLLKDLATFANDRLFAVIVVAHLRKPERHKKNSTPTMDDIAGSAAFKQDSDEVLILNRKTITNDNGVVFPSDEGCLIVTKTKSSGGNGLVNLIFYPQSAFITTLQDADEDDDPETVLQELLEGRT